MIIKKWQSAIDIVFIILIALLLVNAIAGSYLLRIIKNQIENSTHGEYHFDARTFHVNLFSGSIQSDGVSFNSNNPNRTGIYAGRISIENINIKDLLFENKISIKFIGVNNSSVVIRPNPTGEADSADINQDKPYLALYNLFSDKYRSVNVGELTIEDPEIRYYKNRSDTSFLISASSGSLRINNLLIDSEVVYVQKKSFTADKAELVLRNITNILGDSLYTIEIPRVMFSFTDDKVQIDSLTIKPNYSRKEFSKHVGHQTDRFQVSVLKITSDLDVKRLVEKFQLSAKTLIIDSLHLEAFRNKYVNDIIEEKKFIQEMLKDVGMRIRINYLRLNNSYIKYEELTPPANAAGKIFFSGVNASLNNISNYYTDSDLTVNMYVSGLLNDESLLTAHVYFPLGKDYYSSNGVIKNVSMERLNSMLESSSGATITNGKIDSMHFNISSDKNLSTGSLLMIYHDLRIAAKDIKENDTSKTILKIKTFIANTFIIKDQNPEKGKLPRTVEISRKYNTRKFIINNMWKSILNGIQQTIGIKPKEKEAEN